MKFVCLVVAALLTLAATAQTPEEIVQQAGSLYQQNKRPEAIGLLQKGIAQHPGRPVLYGVLSRLYLDSQKPALAYETAGKGLQLNADDENLLLSRAAAAVELDKPAEAIQLTDKLIAKDAAFFMPYYVKGKALDAQGNAPAAIAQFNKAITLNPDFEPAYVQRGLAYSGARNYASAIADFSKAISLAPGDDEAYNSRGVAHYFSGNPQKAIADYTRAVELNPTQIFALTNRGVAYADQKQTEKATADFQKAVSINSRYADPHFQLARLYADDNKLTEAAAEIKKALEGKAFLPAFHALHSKILLRQGNDADALAAANKALSLDAQSADAHFYKAIALSNANRFDEALNETNLGATAAPDDYLLYSLKAFLHRQSGNRSEADAADAKAASLAQTAGIAYKPLLEKNKGCVSGNCNTGVGTYRFPSGNQYTGAFSNRKMEGKGVMEFAEGDRFEGLFAANEKKEGSYRFANGAVYTGTYNAAGKEWNGKLVFNQVVIPFANGVAAVPKKPTPVANTGGSNGSGGQAPQHGSADVMCTECYGAGKKQTVDYGGHYERNSYGIRTVSFANYSTCTACFGKGTKSVRY